MTRRLSSVLILTSLFCLMISLSAFAKRTANEQRRVVNQAAIRVVDYAMPDEHHYSVTSGLGTGEASLDNSGTVGAGFGESIGNTYYEYQNNGGSARQVEWGSSVDCAWTVHFSWMNLESEVLLDRHVLYNSWDGVSGASIGEKDLQNGGDYAGYTALDVTDDNRAVITMHNNEGGGNLIHTYWQFECNLSFFSSSVRIPDTLNAQGNTVVGGAVIWPVVAVQNPGDGDPVVHLIGTVNDFNNGRGFHYFQGVGADGAVTWTYGNAIDTVHAGEIYDLAASEDGTVAIVWIAHPPIDQAACDTCSDNTTVGDIGRTRWDNDLYYQVNRNYGRGTLGDFFDGTTNWWENRVNITNYTDIVLHGSIDGFRAFSDMSAAISPGGDFHVSYVGMVWDDDDFGVYESRIFHWGENLAQYNIRTVASAQWEPENCNTGAFNQNQNKISMSFCDSKLYVFWTEANSPDPILNANHDDCADRAFNGDFTGASNGDIFVSVSADDGLTFDAARNMTNSYGGPTGAPNGACDPATAAGPCPAEHWMSSATYGTNFAVSLPTTSNVIDMGDGFAGANFIDLSYIDDQEPGGAIQNYGAWYNCDIRWVRVGCIEPIPAPGFALSSTSFQFPNYVKNCAQEDLLVVVENTGNTPLTYSAVVTEDPGPSSGWLAVANFNSPVPSGTGNKVTGTISLNNGGSICGAAGSVELNTGRITFNHNATARGVFDYEIEMYVADTVLTITWDSIHTDCIALTVANNGNAGRGGIGGLNMDWVAAGDWKTTSDVYLYDGSLVAGWVDGIGDVDTNMYFGMFSAGSGISSPSSMRPLTSGSSETGTGWGTMIATGSYATGDTTLIFTTNWYSASGASNCGFLLKETIVTAPNGATGVVLGEAVDFDIPSDTTDAYNTGGDDATAVSDSGNTYNYVYQQGVEYPTWNDSIEAWDADERFTALMFLGAYTYDGAGEQIDYNAGGSEHAMYTQDNATFVFPFTDGFDNGFLYQNHSTFVGISHFVGADDLHSGITYLANYDIAADDTVYLYSAFATIMNSTTPARSGAAGLAATMDAAVVAFEENLMHESSSCCLVPGDVNLSGGVDIADLTFTVNFMFKGGADPFCWDNADINASCGVDIADLTYRVNFMFKGGADPVCGCTGLD